MDESLLDETGKLCLDKAKLIVYSHGEYLALGKKLGTFGYTCLLYTSPATHCASWPRAMWPGPSS